MKRAIAALLAAASFAAHAETITLYPTAGFGNLSQWHNIPNSEALPGLSIYFAPTTNVVDFFQASDGINIEWRCMGSLDVQPMNCSDNIPRSLAITYHVITVRPRVCSGRGGCYTRHYWYLDSGTYERP